MSKPNSNFAAILRNKRILITGAGGFIGSHLVEAAVACGASVRALVHYNSRNDWGNFEFAPQAVKDAVEVVTGDVCDPNGVRHVVRGMDVVLHLAALIGIPYSYVSPDSYVDTNIKGTLNVLQAVRDEGCARVLVTSTSEVYGTARYVPIDEAHPFQGQSPYSATKIGADRIAESFYRSFATPVTIVRPFNTYGPRQSARAVIPTIITQLLNGAEQVRLGSLHTTRDLNFVEDICAGFLSIAACDAAIGHELNLATQKEISIGELAVKLIDMINPDARIESDEQRVRPGKSEVERLCGNAEKVRDLTGWIPSHTLQQGLEKTVAWFREGGALGRYKSTIYNV